MTNVLNRWREAARKRALYNRTVAEIQRMPLDMALDLDLYPGDAHRIARAVVYGA